MPQPEEMTPEEKEALRQRMRAMPKSGVERYRSVLDAQGQRKRPAPVNPDQAQPPQDPSSMGPSYGEVMAQRGLKSAEAERDEELKRDEDLMKRTVTTNSQGVETDKLDLGTGTITETRKDGKLVSKKVVQNDATWEPEMPERPAGGGARPGMVYDFNQRPVRPYDDEIRQPDRRRPTESQTAFNKFNATDAYGAQGLPIRPNTSGKLRASDFAGYNPMRMEGLSDNKIRDLSMLRKRLGIGAPQAAAAQEPMRFVPPERTLNNMDWTPTKKLIDYLYGSNLAQGSKDPLEAEFKRALQTFEANVKAGKMRGKSAKSGIKELKDLDALRISLSENPKQQMWWRIKQAQLGRDIIKGMSEAEKLKYWRDQADIREQIDSLPINKFEQDKLRHQLNQDKFTFSKKKWQDYLDLQRSRGLSGDDDSLKVIDKKLNIERKRRQIEKMNEPKPLGQEERKRHDNIEMGLQAISDMDAALSEGGNTFELVGDDDFTIARMLWEEAIGRMQSQGAIRPDEEARFRKMVPTFFDSKDIQIKKLRQIKRELMQRRKAFEGRAVQKKHSPLRYGGGSEEAEKEKAKLDKEIERDEEILRKAKEKRAKGNQ